MCSKELVKLARLYYAHDYSEEHAKDILKRDGDYVAANDSYLEKYKPELLGGTILHFRLDMRYCRESDFKDLLEHGADFTVKNSQGHTVLHQIFRKAHYYVDYRKSITFKNNFNKSYFEAIDAILSAHVEVGNYNNPRDDYGISHFHAACLTDNVEAVQYFLKNNVSVNEAVNMDAPIFPGYTPLHFAASRCCLKTVKVLLEHGANVQLQDNRGFTPLHILLEQYYIVISSKYERWTRTERKVKSREEFEDVLILILAKNDNFIIHEHGLSCLHVACCTKDMKLVRSYLKNAKNLNHSRSMDAPLFPGFAALHFAALCSLDSVKLLLAKGANILAKDKDGLTPFDICVEEYDVEAIHSIISKVSKLRNIVLSDNKTKLQDLVLVLQDTDKFCSFFRLHGLNPNQFVPTASPLWPGYTILHLAVVFSERIVDKLADNEKMPDFEVLKECLRREASINIKNKDGYTPLHLAFRQHKLRIVRFLLEHHRGFSDPVDKDNFSHLHIACAAGNENVVKRLSCNSTNIDNATEANLIWFKRTYYLDISARMIARGATAMHIAVITRNWNSAETLIEHGADLCATDDNGFTPIHLLLHSANSYGSWSLEHVHYRLSPSNLKDSVTSSCGLSHLHAAVLFKDTRAVVKLLAHGANVNQRISLAEPQNDFDDHKPFFCAGVKQKILSNLSEYNGYTPLHLAVHFVEKNMIEVLLEQGADFLTGDANGRTPLNRMFYECYGKLLNEISFMDRFFCDETVRKRVEQRTGLTTLHFACRVRDVELVEQQLRCGANVNAKIFETEDTPLHVCHSLADPRSQAIVHLLLEYGADLMSTNRKGDTPIMALASLGSVHPDSGILEESHIFNLLLESQKDFKINPVNPKGLSHFLIACIRNHPPVIEKFLRNNVDVNQSINYFWQNWTNLCGDGPLHLALRSLYQLHDDSLKFSETIELLIANGADVNAEDGHGNTPLHLAARREHERHIVLEKLLQAGADLQKKNIYGDTPFETLLHSKHVTAQDWKCFLSRGCQIYDYHPTRKVSYISMIIESARHYRSQKGFDEVLKICDVTKADAKDRTALHNTIAASPLTRCPIESCFDFYECHYDVSYNVRRLVSLGCDVDHQDVEGKTALHVATELRNPFAVSCLLKNGADLNITDSNGNTPLHVFMNESNPKLCDEEDDFVPIDCAFAQHLKMLQLFKLEISQLNLNVRYYLQGFNNDDSILDVELNNELQVVQNQTIGSSSMRLKDLMSETGIVANYSHLSIDERQAIDGFFQTIDDSRFSNTIGLLRLQYSKALKRAALIESAINCFRLIIKFPLPHLCCEAVLKYLSNDDLRTLMKSTTESL